MTVAGIRGQRVYGQHGPRHQPLGSDPAWIADPLLAGDIAMPFINGANAAPSALVPNPQPLQVSFLVGPPNDCEYGIPGSGGWGSGSGASTDPISDPRPVATAIIEYRPHLIEIVGDVTDVNIGDVVIVIPMEYRYPDDRPCKGHDDAGNYVACRLLSTGEFIWGQP